MPHKLILSPLVSKQCATGIFETFFSSHAFRSAIFVCHPAEKSLHLCKIFHTHTQLHKTPYNQTAAYHLNMKKASLLPPKGNVAM
jgi:hypothetical protein